MAFEVFAKRRSGTRVSLALNGSYGTLSAEATRLIGEPTHVTLLYDRDHGLIGIRPTTDDNRDAYGLSRHRQVQVGSFVKHYGLPMSRVRLDGRVEDGMLVFPVNQNGNGHA